MSSNNLSSASEIKSLIESFRIKKINLFVKRIHETTFFQEIIVSILSSIVMYVLIMNKFVNLFAICI